MPRKNLIILASFLGIVILISFAGLLSQERFYFFGSNDFFDRNDLAVLVLGEVASGEGGRWHQAPQLADTIVLVYYQSDTQTVNLISLPRDLYGEFGGEWFKLNEVDRRNKIDGLLDKLPEMTTVKTDKFIIVDLTLVKEVVDDLGGIDIVLDSPVTDPVSGFQMKAGLNHLSGDDAVWLIRNRYAPQGDFFREKNQHLVVQAIFSRLSQLNTAEKTKFFLRILPETRKMKANFSVSDILPQLRETGTVKFNSIVLDFGTGLLASTYIDLGEAGAAYVLVPQEGVNKYEAIRQYISSRIR